VAEGGVRVLEGGGLDWRGVRVREKGVRVGERGGSADTRPTWPHVEVRCKTKMRASAYSSS
jgi:hypothetical protein